MNVPLENFFYDFIMPLTEPFLRMQLRGVRVDTVRRAELHAKYTLEKNEAIERVSRFAGRPIVKRDKDGIITSKTISSTELIKLLYSDLGLPPQRNRKTHELTADKNALQFLESKVDDSMRENFLDIVTVRELCTTISTFLEAELGADGRLRWSNNIAGTKTGRISTSSDPWGRGNSVQNWPEECREIVVADPGFVFICGDGEQADARTVAWLSQDPGLLSIYRSGLNSHAHIANRLFGVPLARTEDEITALKKTPVYKRTKNCAHAGNYGVGKRKLALMMRCLEAFAEEKLRHYHSEFPGVRSKFQNDIVNQLSKTRTLVTPFGRSRTFFGSFDDDMKREGFAQIPQSTTTDWLDFGLLRLTRFQRGIFSAPAGPLSQFLELGKPQFVSRAAQLTEVEIQPTIQIHDALKAQVLAKDLELGLDIVREALTFEIPFEAGPLVIPAEVKIGVRWGELRTPTPEWIKECKAISASTN